MHIIASDSISTATLSATSTAGGFSVNNLKNDQRASTWRSTAVTSQTITATWATAQTINAVGIAFANFLVNSTVRIRLFTNTGDVTPIQDSGVQTIAFVYDPVAGFSANNLSSFPYGGGNYYFKRITQAAIRKMEIIMVNPAGVDAFIEVARIVAGDAFEPDYGADFGAEVGVNDLSQLTRTDSGNSAIYRRPMTKTMSLDLSLMPAADRSAMQEIVRRNGSHTPVFVSAYETATSEAMRVDHMIYGHIVDLGGMSLNSAVYSSLPLRIEEI